MSIFSRSGKKQTETAPAGSRASKEMVALDLGSSQLKAVVTDKEGLIERTIVEANPLEYAIPTQSTQVEAVGKLLKDFFTKNKLPKRNVGLAMPEKYVSTQVISIPTLTDSELASSINWQARQYIPIPEDELVLTYQVLYRPDKKDAAVKEMRILLEGINRHHLQNLTAACRQAGFEPTVLETESLATIRHYQSDSPDASCMIINFGASGLDLIILSGEEIAMAISHQTGSSMVTKALMNTFNLTFDKAEEYKKNYGVDSRHAEGRIAQAIVPIAQTILGDIKNTLTFYNNKNPAQKISRLLICGGGAQMPGFPELLAANLNLEIVPLAIFANLAGNIPSTDHLLYPVSAGLIKRGQK